MNKQQEEEFLEEESNFKAKRTGCLLILGAVLLEAVGVAAGTAYYLKNHDGDQVVEPSKILKHDNPKNQVETEHSR